MKKTFLILFISCFALVISQAQNKEFLYREDNAAGIVTESALKVSINNMLNIPTANQILYSNGTNLVGSSGLTFNGSSLSVTGTGVFSGTVSGANATSAGQFTTLSQLQGAVSGTTNTIPKFTGVNTIGNSALTDVSGILTYTGESRAVKFTSTGTAITGKSYLKNQIVGIPSEGQLDFTNFIWGDRDYMKDVALWGDVTVSITGAGTFTDTRANKNNMFDLAATNFVFTGLDATSTAITITCDLKVNQDIYNRALVMPYIIYRTSSYTRYNACKVEVSTDNTNWYTITDATNILSDYNIAWYSNEVLLSASNGYAFRYVRYTLTDKVSASDNARCEISMLGLKHVNAPFFPSLITKAGGNIWGDLRVYNEGGITTPLITLAKTGSVTGVNYVSTVATGTQPYATTSTTLNTNLNADLLDGQHGTFYQNASNVNAGTLADARLSSNVSLDNIDNNFSVNQTIPNATANGHALNRITADGRFLGITATATNSNALRGLDTNVIAQRNQVNTFTQRNTFDNTTNFNGTVNLNGTTNMAAIPYSGYVDGTDRMYIYKGDGEVRSILYQELVNANSANDTFALTGTSGAVFNLSSNLVTVVDLGVYTNSTSTNSTIEFRLPSAQFYDNQMITVMSTKSMTFGQGAKIRLADNSGNTLVQLCNDALSALSEEYEFNSNPVQKFTLTFQYSKKRNKWRIVNFKEWGDL